MHQRCLEISSDQEHSERLHSSIKRNNHNDYRKRPPKGAVICNKSVWISNERTKNELVAGRNLPQRV